ncbi:MAG: RNase adapter protein RapZ [Nitrosomonas europaea]|nr:MAG: glmZ(sRNA)-inactivating NTPase [Nitrosomonas europaea]MBV6389552.1 RNase adapter protein RapZ [Nitrosomonas europaea]
MNEYCFCIHSQINLPVILKTMQVIIISGLSGSGKSIALKVLEDSGYYCVDNLPASLLVVLINHLQTQQHAYVAVAIDMRSGENITVLPWQLKMIDKSIQIKFIFLEARTETLMQRFSETRRRHPLSDKNITLEEAIRREREALATLTGLGHHIDTSSLRPNALRAFIKDFIADSRSPSQLTLLFQSFGYKHGIPLDADLVFDIRCLPNPFYDPQLKELTGHDPEVIRFMESQPDASKMLRDISSFLGTWLPAYIRDNRAYLTVAIGCTGGQHRSVYFAEKLALHFHDSAHVLVRHRGLAEYKPHYARR